MKNFKNIIGIVIFAISSISLAQQDSIAVKDIDYKLEKIEGFQTNVEDSINNKFKDLEIDLKNEYSIIKNIVWGILGINVIWLAGFLWKSNSYIDKKIKDKFDKIITQRESDILDVMNNNDVEKQILKTKKILVLTSKEGDDMFLRKFFKTMSFPLDNIDYQKVNSYENHFDKFDLIFANNEDDSLGLPLTEEYFEKSPTNTVLFYFGKSFYPRDKPEANRLNFANSRTQIYGNLINLLKYQDLVE